ncbi:hypothetical protein PIB30_066769 [Stylosanthes scabra]|uniref:Uncharacterized protein n=1 Tax=Stylosanthes scabra TaxID=79078 RepID=A0ABU6ZL62_9FABA|nr:hypothetical protein [Stylosanthes scabra]
MSPFHITLESSPIDADEENEERQEIPSQALLTPPAFEAKAPSPTEHARSEPQDAINVLDDELPVSEANLTHQFGDFISGLYSSDLLALADRKKELDAVVHGWKLLCRRASDCSEATSQISQVLKQGKKSEQKAVARIKALEDELAAVKEGLVNIRSANDDISDKLKHYEGNKASLASAASKA